MTSDPQVTERALALATDDARYWRYRYRTLRRAIEAEISHGRDQDYGLPIWYSTRMTNLLAQDDRDWEAGYTEDSGKAQAAR